MLPLCPPPVCPQGVPALSLAACLECLRCKGDERRQRLGIRAASGLVGSGDLEAILAVQSAFPYKAIHALLTKAASGEPPPPPWLLGDTEWPLPAVLISRVHAHQGPALAFGVPPVSRFLRPVSPGTGSWAHWMALALAGFILWPWSS